MRDAAEYLAAAQALDDAVGSEAGFETLSPKPSYYLACNGIELAAKAVLVHAGWTENQLRSVGHGLVKVVAAAKSVGMNISLTADEDRLLDLLDKEYVRLRYPEPGAIELPIWGPLTDIMIKVMKGALGTIPNGEEAVREQALDRLTGFVSWHT